MRRTRLRAAPAIAPPEARLGAEPVAPPDAATRAVWRDCLAQAYPDREIGAGGALGPLLPAALLNSDEPLDAFRWRYPLAAEPLTPPSTDPGRVRPASHFTRIYGDCARGEVNPRLAKARWVGGENVLITTVNDIASRFERVARAIEAMPRDIVDFCRSPGAGYQCRAIAGTRRRSMHGYGAAFDLDPERTQYWQWSDEALGGIAPYANTVPLEIVAAFEAEGFIWGGRWAHFDTMHFEYRPELILAARA